MAVSKKTIVTTRQRGTFLLGWFSGKYYGLLNESRSSSAEKVFNITIYEGKLTIDKSDYGQIARKESINEANIIEKLSFNGSLCEPLLIVIKEGDQNTHYNIKLNEPTFVKLAEYEETPIVHLYARQTEGHEVFGKIEGYLSGYIYDSETVTSEIEYEPHKSKLQQKVTSTIKNKVTPNYFRGEDIFSAFWSFISFFLVGIFLLMLGVNFLPLGIIFLIGALFYLLRNAIQIAFSFVGWLLFIGFGLSFFSAFIKAFNRQQTSYITENDSPKEEKEHIDVKDSVIYHHRIWNDYNGNKYEADIKIHIADVRAANNFRENYPMIVNDEKAGYTSLLQNIYEHDSSSLSMIYAVFDSIGDAKKLDRQGFAEMVVSCVQDINYYLILPEECNAVKYNNPFITDYLRNGGKCEGFVRFGIYTPAEFVSTIKGDCDTRTLTLFTILAHYNYSVAILSSDFYNHSILAVNLPGKVNLEISGINLALWETTYKGFRAGEIPHEINDLSRWEVSLTNLNKPFL